MVRSIWCWSRVSLQCRVLLGDADHGPRLGAPRLLLPSDRVGQARHRALRPVERVPTLDERADDLRAVMDAAGSERAALFGISEGGPMGMLFAAAHPERTTALVLHGVSPKFSSSPDWDWGWSPEEITDRPAELERDWGEAALIDLFAPSRANDEAARQVWPVPSGRGPARPWGAPCTRHFANSIVARYSRPSVSRR